MKVGACCDALAEAAGSAPLADRGAYIVATNACESILHDPPLGDALASIRASLAEHPIPPACEWRGPPERHSSK